MVRFHDIDALRSFTMLLVILFHISAFTILFDFWPVHEGYAYITEFKNNPYAYFLLIVYGYIMHLFFMISGFFTAILWQTRGLYHLAQHRLKRIALPLLVSLFTVVPILSWLFNKDTFRLSHWPIIWMDGVYHLWFLWYLLLMDVVFIILVWLGLKFRHYLWWLLIPLAFIPGLFHKTIIFGPDIPSLNIFPDQQLFWYYIIFFIFGVFVYQRKVEMKGWWTIALLPALILFFPVYVTLLYPKLLNSSQFSWVWCLSSVIQLIFAWLMSFGMIGLFRMVASKERFWLRYISDASYWSYIWHLPLVIICQMLFLNWSINVHLKFLFTCIIVIIILLFTYQFFVRYTLIGTVLNGPRTRR